MLAPACTSCGFVNGRHDRFCGGCGIRAGSAQPVNPDTLRTPKRQPELFTMMTAGTERERVRAMPREASRSDKPARVEPSTMPIEVLDEIQ
jgi:hypothetical protein